MKTRSFSTLSAAVLAAAVFYAVPATSQARDHDDDDHHHHRSESSHRYTREYYVSRPRSTFTLSLGEGYRGRGYYYGPAGATYYYEAPGVIYYRTREQAPREYYSAPTFDSRSYGMSVQRELTRRGYYHSEIDGTIGPHSREAIARYQADHGLRPTGEISPSLIRSLGLD